MKILKILKFVWRYRKALSKLKDDLWGIRTKIADALKDSKMERSELLEILREIDAVVDVIIDIVED